MKTAVVDLNVILDVIQKRDPHFAASARVLAAVSRNTCSGLLPAHAITTIHYIVGKYSGKKKADETVDWLLAVFDVPAMSSKSFFRARTLEMRDFEDAVVAEAALAAGSDVIVTRNVADFCESPVPAVTPEEFLAGNEEQV